MAFIKQGNKEYVEIKKGEDYSIYYVSRINGKPTYGRQGSYIHLKCDICGKIIGTQFNGFSRHYNTHKKVQ